MRIVLAALVLMFLDACGSNYGRHASKCGVTEEQMRRAFAEVSHMPPYSGKRVGQCDLIVDDGEDVSVITPEIQERVEEMIACEKAHGNSDACW